MNKLKNELNKIANLTEQELSLIVNSMEKKEFKKGSIIHYGGEIMQDLYYLSSGVAKSSFYSENGAEFIWQLYFNFNNSHIKNAILDDCVSFYEQSPSELTFEALEDVALYKIPMQKLEEIYKQNCSWQKVALHLQQNAYNSAYKRVISMMSKDAKTRYNELVSKNPNIFNYVKSYHIAAYIGITPQSLSRLRKN